MEPGRWLNSHQESGYREIFIEHLFISDLLQHCAFVRDHKVEVLRSEVDNSGYDLVLEHGDVIRHVQLKSGSGQSVDVNVKLQDHVGGCVVWMRWKHDAPARAILEYRWFGNPPNQQTRDLGPEKPPKRGKPGEFVESKRRLRRGLFNPATGWCGIDVLADHLFASTPREQEVLERTARLPRPRSR